MTTQRSTLLHSLFESTATTTTATTKDSTSNTLSSTTAVVLVAAVTTLVAAGLHVAIASRRKARRELVTCHCGKIEIELYQPAANYLMTEIPSFLCACKDCVGFVDKVLASGFASKAFESSSSSKVKEFCTPGVPNWIMYDSEILVLQGHEFIQSMKLTEHSDNRRIYSKCCGTPLGISVDGTSVNMVFPPNRKKSPPSQPNYTNSDTIEFPELPPCCCVFASQANPTKPVYPDGMIMYKGAFAPRLIWHCLYRLTLLAIVGERGSGSGFPIMNGIPYGLHTIHVNNPQ